MSAAPKKRSTILVAVGAGVFVIGTGLAALATRDTGGTTHASTSNTTVVAQTGAVGAPAAGGAAFTIPDGHQAMAVELPFVEGLAGYAKAGDLVNVYGAYKTLPITASPDDPIAKLVLQKVEVLAVTTGGDASKNTYVLSVSTSDAEAMAYLTTFQKVWLTLARDDQGPQAPKGFSDNNG
ncbi:MAG: Flp pilus assembly protein RcpC/CpaB [Actinomycetota bacterium]|jgi:hypothetical protein